MTANNVLLDLVLPALRPFLLLVLPLLVALLVLPPRPPQAQFLLSPEPPLPVVQPLAQPVHPASPLPALQPPAPQPVLPQPLRPSQVVDLLSPRNRRRVNRNR